MSEMKKDKKALRRQLKSHVPFSSDSDKKRADLLLCDALLSLDAVIAAKMIFCYIGMGSEPDTLHIISRLLEMGKIVCAPVCESANPPPSGAGTANIMTANLLTSAESLRPGRYGILEPDGAVVDKADIGVAIVPGAAFDTSFNRLGHGAGYYDRFLTGTDILKIAVCYDSLLLDSVPAEPHDVKMDMIITQTRLLRRV